MRLRTTLVAAAVMATLPVVGISTVAAQRPEPELPQEVKDWLDRDRLQRWEQQLQTGEKVFADGVCSNCHGQGGSGGRFGPDLTDGEWLHSDGSLRGIRDTILWGVRREDLADPDSPFMLPSGGMQLPWEDLVALSAYVWSLSNGTYIPER